MFRQWGDTLVIVCETSRHIEGVEIQKTLVDMARRTFQFNDVDEIFNNASHGFEKRY